MTFGIDIASSQRDIDLVRAKSEGVEFVIVKMGGLNVTPQYVAPYYRAQIDRAIAAGLPKGHYYLIGRGQSPEQQAEFFVSNLHRFDPARDILALDNEALDGNGTRWGDGDAARFIRRVIALTGIPAARVWHYAGASDYRATGAWPELVELGVRFWWAAYGGYPTGRTPDHEPSLQGSIPRWDVHQYSSKASVAGYALDGNYSRETVDELFGGIVPLNNYTLRPPATVIAADSRDPWVSWQNHLDRTGGARGGVDIVAVVGTPIYARTSGTMLHIPNDGSAGNSCRFHHDANPGWSDVFSHLSRYVGWSGQHFNAGEVIGYTGATGAVTQHLHWHLLDPNGVRRNPWNYFSAAGTSGGATTPIEEFLMAISDAEQRELVDGIRTVRRLVESTEFSREGVRLIQVQTIPRVTGGWFLVNVDPKSPRYGSRVELGPGRLALARQYLRGEEINAVQLDQVLAMFREVLVGP